MKDLVEAGNILEAHYELKPNISVYCKVRVIDVMAEDRLLISVGLRKLDDASLPKGAKLVIKSKNLKATAEYQDQYTARVEECNLSGKGVYWHSLTSVKEERLNYKRRDRRRRMQLSAKRDEQLFRTANISWSGMRFLYPSDSPLTSAALDGVMTLNLEYQTHVIPMDCHIRYVQYNWWTNVHSIGAAFLNVTAKQEAFLHNLLGPREDNAAVSDEELDEACSKVTVSVPEEYLEQSSTAEVVSVAEKAPTSSKKPEETANDKPPEETTKKAEPKKQTMLIDPETGSIKIM